MALALVLPFLVEVFKSLFLLKLMMDLVDTLLDVRYWSEVLCCTIPAHLTEILVKVFRSLFLLNLELELTDTLHDTGWSSKYRTFSYSSDF